MSRILLILLVFTSIQGFTNPCGKALETKADPVHVKVTSLQQLYSLGTNSIDHLEMMLVLNDIKDSELRKNALEQTYSVLKLSGTASLVDRLGYAYHKEDLAAVMNLPTQILSSVMMLEDDGPYRALKFQKVVYDPFVHTGKHTAVRKFSRW